MKVALIGSGGREHALAWKLLQSPRVDQLTCIPGNAGIAEIAKCEPIKADDIAGLIDYIETEAFDFVVVGPEQPLALGLVDDLLARNIKVFGPTQAAAQLESSKAFTKEFCSRHNIPTAAYGVFTELAPAKAFLATMHPPFVLKADGLAAGKGVVIPESLEEAESELEEFFSGKFGDASAKVVIEEFMRGQEVSFFAISDGQTALPLIGAQDHKRAFDGDQGPNTGGMGAYAPPPVFTKALEQRVLDEIITPTTAGMTQDGHPFVGVLFAGLMITEDGPKLIEYNARFGDPECQVLMRALQSDLMDIMIAAADHDLDNLPAPQWSDDAIVNIVLATQGYPGSYEKGSVIQGIEKADAMDGLKVFHAGTGRNENADLIATGGRVLNITASGASIRQAVNRAYQAIDEAIDWPEGFCRRDIAHHALKT